MLTDSVSLTLLFVSEKESRTECCVGLLRGTSRIKELLRPPGKFENYYLEWEEIHSNEPGLKEAPEGTTVHLVFHSAQADPGSISFTFPGQSLILATLDRELALLALQEERMKVSPQFVQLWSVAVGWEAPGLQEFLKRAREGE